VRAVKGWFSAWFPALGWAGVLFWLSSIPGTSLPHVPGNQTDKLVHGVLYLVLGVFCVRGLRPLGLPASRALALAAVLATAYGVSDELHQIFTPNRSADWHDVAADAAGGLAGAALATSWARRQQRAR
jgi:VanZ family protein